jgi:hypothetical protein
MIDFVVMWGEPFWNVRASYLFSPSEHPTYLSTDGRRWVMKWEGCVKVYLKELYQRPGGAKKNHEYHHFSSRRIKSCWTWSRANLHIITDVSEQLSASTFKVKRTSWALWVLKMAASSSFEISITARHHILQYLNIHEHRCMSLRSWSFSNNSRYSLRVVPKRVHIINGAWVRIWTEAVVQELQETLSKFAGKYRGEQQNIPMTRKNYSAKFWTGYLLS